MSGGGAAGAEPVQRRVRCEQPAARPGGVWALCAARAGLADDGGDLLSHPLTNGCCALALGLPRGGQGQCRGPGVVLSHLGRAEPALRGSQPALIPLHRARVMLLLPELSVLLPEEFGSEEFGSEECRSALV